MGVGFVHPTRLLAPQRRGWLTQFDATRKLNRWGHNMFSFLVRNEHNVWIPTPHLVAWLLSERIERSLLEE